MQMRNSRDHFQKSGSCLILWRCKIARPEAIVLAMVFVGVFFRWFRLFCVLACCW